MVNQSLTEQLTEQAKSEPIPPLESGDRLSRHEFERRYEAMPHIQKAELVEGVVYVASLLRFESHAKQHGWIIIAVEA